MPLNLLLLADTHLPKRAKALPAQVWAAVESADVVFHAGDWVSEQLLDELQRRSRSLVGVYGNNDGPDLRSRLPETAAVTLEGVRFATVRRSSPVPTCWFSGTATSPGTPLRKAGCGCSTPAPLPTGAASRSAHI
jgi:putative phosphoesterase